MPLKRPPATKSVASEPARAADAIGAETSAAIARAAAAESEREKARSERDLVRRDADALYASTLRSREGLGAAGVATCRLALNRLDDIEARAIGTYAVAAGEKEGHLPAANLGRLPNDLGTRNSPQRHP